MTPAATTRTLYYGIVAAVLATLAFGGLLAPVSGRPTAEIAVAASKRAVPPAAPLISMSTDPRPVLPDARYGRLLTSALTQVPVEQVRIRGARGQQPVVTRADGTVVRVIRNPVPEPSPALPAGRELTATGTVDPDAIAPQFPMAVPDRTEPEVPLTLEERGQAAYEAVDFDLADLDYEISFHGPEFGYLGMTFLDENRIEIYARPTLSDDELAFVVGHEIGHAVDHMLNSPEDRQRWREARGVDPDVRWWPAQDTTDWGSLAGDFAECFAAWLTGEPSKHVETSCDGTEELIEELATIPADEDDAENADEVNDGEPEVNAADDNESEPGDERDDVMVDQLAAVDANDRGGSPERP